MLRETSADLLASKRKALLDRLIVEISRGGYDLYYAPTSAVAAYLLQYVKETAQLNADELDLLAGLTRRDIEVILSLKE